MTDLANTLIDQQIWLKKKIKIREEFNPSFIFFFPSQNTNSNAASTRVTSITNHLFFRHHTIYLFLYSLLFNNGLFNRSHQDHFTGHEQCVHTVTTKRYDFHLNPSKHRNPSATLDGLEHPCTACMSSILYLWVLHRLSIGRGGAQVGGGRGGQSAQEKKKKIKIKQTTVDVRGRRIVTLTKWRSLNKIWLAYIFCACVRS